MHEKTAAPAATRDDRAIRRARIKMLAILAVCAAPVIASYFTYYVIQPEGRTNYGALVEPQREVSGLQARGLDGSEIALSQFRGKWVLLSVDSAACGKSCEDKLYAIRQVRLTTGKDRDRIERVFLLSDAGTPDERLQREYEGTAFARVDPQALLAAFPAPPGGSLADHIYVIDPLGNLMMRFPTNADPNRMKKDIAKLLRASRIG
jgi:hypothetical protein